MIIKNKKGNDILKSGETRIAFAVNTEGYNDAGFAGIIAEKYWPELKNIGKCKIGTVLTHTFNGLTFYALVCHSLDRYGWKNQTEIIRKCFDSIKTDEPIATVSIGQGIIGKLCGANIFQITLGMELSKKKFILY